MIIILILLFSFSFTNLYAYEDKFRFEPIPNYIMKIVKQYKAVLSYEILENGENTLIIVLAHTTIPNTIAWAVYRNKTSDNNLFTLMRFIVHNKITKKPELIYIEGSM